MNILGISFFFGDSAACLVQDGVIAAAVQEERFTRNKHDRCFPVNSVKWCLKDKKIRPSEVDFVIINGKPLKDPKNVLKKEIGIKGQVLFCGHNVSQPASAFYPSPFEKAAFLTVGGLDDLNGVSFGFGSGNHLNILGSFGPGYSLGLFYSVLTNFLGFKINSDEYKVMGLAPYGEPRYADLIIDNLFDINASGLFKLKKGFFCSHDQGSKNKKLARLFGLPQRKPESRVLKKHMDIAASVQKVTEEAMLNTAIYVHKITGQDRLCLAGSVALNCAANGRLVRESPFKEIWIQPASGNPAAALGAALFLWYARLGNERFPDGDNDYQKGSLLGPMFDDQYIESFLKKRSIPHVRFTKDTIARRTAELIESGNVVAWFQGRLEFGPRALGSRSIIADARNPDMHSRLNNKVKFRENFRPFAPAVLEEKARGWFDLDRKSPYMLLVAQVKKDKRLEEDVKVASLSGLNKLKVKRSLVPSVTHVDCSARIQTVSRKINPLFYKLLTELDRTTGCPVIINTSFNVRGEPIVLSPEDAFKCFMRTDIDYLVMGSFLLDKKEQ